MHASAQQCLHLASLLYAAGYIREAFRREVAVRLGDQRRGMDLDMTFWAWAPNPTCRYTRVFQTASDTLVMGCTWKQMSCWSPHDSCQHRAGLRPSQTDEQNQTHTRPT